MDDGCLYCQIVAICLQRVPIVNIQHCFIYDRVPLIVKYVVKHKSAKLLMTFAVGKLEAGTVMC